MDSKKLNRIRKKDINIESSCSNYNRRTAFFEIKFLYTLCSFKSLARSWIYATLQRVPTFPCATGSAMVDRDKELEVHQYTQESHAVQLKLQTSSPVVGQVHQDPRVSQSQYLGQGQKVLRSPVRRDTGESLTRRAHCTFTLPVLPCAFANCNSDTMLLHREARHRIRAIL